MSDVGTEKEFGELKLNLTDGNKENTGCSGMLNNAYVIDDTISTSRKVNNSSVEPYPTKPPAYEEAMGSEMKKLPPNDLDAEAADKEIDAKILNVLRDVARKCTNANPEKRPTAKEVLKMLEEVAPEAMLAEKFDISDDELEDDDDQREKPGMKKGFYKKRL